MGTETCAWHAAKIQNMALAGVKESQISLELAFYEFLGMYVSTLAGTLAECVYPR